MKKILVLLVLAGAVVAAGARVVDSVVMAGASILEGAVVEGSLVGSGATVGRDARLLELTVVGHGGAVEAGERLVATRRPDEG